MNSNLKKHTGTELVVLQDIESGKLLGVDALHSENLDACAGEAALWCLGGALHEEDDGS